ncbi:MAG: GtrA family protein [Eubacterium sp.]|nr:GtrA family protein [Eubacterium sp.]
MKKIKNFIANIYISIVKFIYKILHKEFTADDRHVWLQFLGFAIIGCSNFIVQYIVFTGCYYLIDFNEQISNICGFFISVFNAFFWNNKLVFKGKKTFKELVFSLLKTYVSYGVTGLILTAALLFVEVQIIHIPAFIAPFINLAITTPINFFLNKLWAFNDKSGMKDMFDEDENNSSTE